MTQSCNSRPHNNACIENNSDSIQHCYQISSRPKVISSKIAVLLHSNSRCILVELFPFKYPITWDIEYLGEYSNTVYVIRHCTSFKGFITGLIRTPQLAAELVARACSGVNTNHLFGLHVYKWRMSQTLAI